ncbi:MAG: EthD domain-containing protein [Acidiferrobacterales bacterium]
MVRFINCIRRRADITPTEFRRFWKDPKFDDLIQKTLETYKAVKSSKSLALQIEASEKIQEARQSALPYDGIIEYWWNSGAEIIDIFESPEAQALSEEMNVFQLQFVDFEGSTLSFTEA